MATDIMSVARNTIPNASGNGALVFKILNGTNRAYDDTQIYWAVLGMSNNRWNYLDRSGQLHPISMALNDAPGHLSKNGANYANIYTRVSEVDWVNLPKIVSGRMFLSVGSPCFIKTHDNGFAGPDLNNPSDPNRDVYHDFIEFTIDNSGYHGNTTRVDAFGFPIQHRLVNRSGNFDLTFGELENETRDGLFAKFRHEVPEEFKTLAEIQAPYRIVAPIHGSFAPGKKNDKYFDAYSNNKYTTQQILLCNGPLAQEPEIGSALNRHVFRGNTKDVTQYYKSSPANYYAKFWHDHSIGQLAYGFAYDDYNGQASYLEIGDPKALIIRIGWNESVGASGSRIPTGVIALRSNANGKFVCAENAGNSSLIANRDAASSWETFELISLDGNNVALKSRANGKYVCAENAGDGPLIANRSQVSSWETFRLIDRGNGKVALIAVNGKYVCADDFGNSELIANRTSVDSWETFDLTQQ
ncbi:unnamed protein product [Rotaria sp. Silwood2]|nr:unnamed protein product [Rotaria sp. Silwood2]CAF2685539.1 unnamed protein product [Rotaria sp. Silwood2]CAF2949040.1 unnamed protein product [Rotaria sp. Silwood2]CAF4020943.1 unnamed protein product [Rotaria sp. Silwood2]CAF4030102.1 unnamed protein product [Rotaria sp. Silwood2]